MLNNLNRINLLLSHQEKRKFLILILVSIFSAIFEVVGVVSILPFMEMLMDDSYIQNNALIFSASKKFNLEEYYVKVLTGSLVIVLLIISLGLKSIVIYLNQNFVWTFEYNLSKKIVDIYMHRPYAFFLDANTSNLSKTILTEIRLFITGCVSPILVIVTQGFVVLFLISSMLYIEPHTTLISASFLAIIYLTTYLSFNNLLANIGVDRNNSNHRRFQHLSDMFGAVKEIKSYAVESFFLKKFNREGRILRDKQILNQLIAQLPRNIIEFVSFAGIIIFLLVTLGDKDFINTIPVLAFVVFAAYKLLPAFQQIYQSATQLNFYNSSLDEIFDAINFDEPGRKRIASTEGSDQSISFHKAINLKDLKFNYPQSNIDVLKNINLEININTLVAFVGVSGSAKTTLIDLILGLHKQSSGNIYIDGVALNETNYQEWLAEISYVPQSIYLLDECIISNIVFGHGDNVDLDLVHHVAKIANIFDFITKELPLGFSTVVGERGVRLSGGQRQRIGIARALYKNPKVLILDEATSALDNITETSLMRSLASLSKSITIIVIAHRLSTIEYADNIFVLSGGEVVSEGKYDDLLKTCPMFSKMVNNRDTL
ncbi:MAG: ABC transporter ATP-binding protein [Paracoccaceae bacterium]